MPDFSDHWWSSVEAAAVVGQRLGASAGEFNAACEHIVQLLIDASMLLEGNSHATAAFLSITAIEETAKVHIGSFRRSTTPVARRKDPLYGHAEKHKLALGPTVAMGNRLQAAIGEDRMRELMEQGQAGDLVKIREAALYVEQGAGGLVTPSSAVSPQTSRELLLLAIEAFDDALVGFTSRSLELGQATDALFSRWADA
ncbi:AbiV family abortive infection protein [Bradyrhizobium sp. 157]|uniref:AbiV family abortive infection protein n=1 Tax=Bradyrhizobium sp. 157 TaxID=2782631 RepID=UPI001FF99BC0|nr:AbiV family abortive infection protein [Bradyrhizobium sp. 157]MCK1639414.1 AbiV family abortive infection protein [Bradyrhizobium sp. 157]